MTEDERNRSGDRPQRVTSLSPGELVQKLVRDVSDLLRIEGQLIRAEMNEKLTQLQVGIGKIAAGGVMLLVALIVFADALVVAVAKLIGTVGPTEDSTALAALIVGGVFALVGAVLVRSGVSNINPENLTPDRTASQVRRDTHLAKEQIR